MRQAVTPCKFPRYYERITYTFETPEREEGITR
jgi:hypothetical protein